MMAGGAGRMGGAPVMVMNQKVQREQGRKAQLSNIQAGKAAAMIQHTFRRRAKVHRPYVTRFLIFVQA